MNSLKHAEKNGTVKISCGVTDRDKYLEIIDQGNNYSKNQIDNLINFFSENKKINLPQIAQVVNTYPHTNPASKRHWKHGAFCRRFAFA